MRVWYRALTRIRKMRSTNPPPETPIKLSSPAVRLPLEIVEMIMTHLICDRQSLLACSLTCYSWYIAAVPHLHHTLTTETYGSHWFPHPEPKWPEPLLRMHNLGLLPLVKKLHIYQNPGLGMDGLFPRGFRRRILHHFSTLTNLQELGIDCLDIPKFSPELQQCFHHFSPTLRTLTLREPSGSSRQIIYFIGLFQHLEDLKLLFDRERRARDSQEGPVDDSTTPTPSFIPPLRGQLTMRFSRGVGLLKGMIDLFGGLRFHSVDLFCVDGMRLLLDACAGTLETLRLCQAGQ